MIRNGFIACALLCAGCLLLGSTPGLRQGAAADAAVTAVPANDFLNTIGTISAIATRGEDFQKTLECAKYLGVRWVRSGAADASIQQFTDLHKQANVKFSLMLSQDCDIPNLIAAGKQFAEAGMLLAFEGPDEPNTAAITYKGKKGGGPDSWLAVAEAMRDMYKAVKSDPVLSKYPVFNVSDNGAQNDNCGLQFLKIPAGAGTLMPDGTQYADYANCHIYVSHHSIRSFIDNLVWNSAGTDQYVNAYGGHVDGIYGTYCETWKKHFKGMPQADLAALPKVVTANGWHGEGSGKFNEENQALIHLAVYLDHFKRNWSYVSMCMKDPPLPGEAGSQFYGAYKKDYTPRKWAVALHNFTTILADTKSIEKPGKLAYSIPSQPETVHDLLLQKSDGTFELVVWDEKFTGGSDEVKVNLGAKFASVKVFEPMVAAEAARTLQNVDTVPLTLSNHAMIIELAPAK